MATLQVKGMDDRLYEALGARAKMDNRSISQEVIALIRQFLATPPADTAKASKGLADLSGGWEDSRSPEEIIDDLRKARSSTNRFGGDDVFA